MSLKYVNEAVRFLQKHLGVQIEKIGHTYGDSR